MPTTPTPITVTSTTTTGLDLPAGSSVGLLALISVSAIGAGDTWTFKLQWTDGLGNTKDLTAVSANVTGVGVIPLVLAAPFGVNVASPFPTRCVATLSVNGGTPTITYAVTILRTTMGMQGVAHSQAEILVDPSDSTTGPAIQSAISYARSVATSSNPITVRLLPGVHAVSTLIDASTSTYVHLRGAGPGTTLILRAAAQNDSGATIRATDSVIDFSGSTGCSIQDVMIEHDGAVSGTAHPCGVGASNVLGFRMINVRILSTYIGVDQENTAFPSGDSDAAQTAFHNCRIVVITTGSDVSADTLYCGKSDIRLYSCYFEMSSNLSGPDCIATGSGSRFVMVGCEAVRRQIGAGAGTGRALYMNANGATVLKVYAVGCRFYNDWTNGDINNAVGDAATVDLPGTTSTVVDTDISLVGCKIDYESGALTSARTFCGLSVGPFGTGGVAGTIRLDGTEIHDLGGSGATNRKDVVSVVSATGGIKQAKAIYVNGGRVSSWTYRSLAGTPAVVHTAMVAEEPTANYQTGTATLSAGTVTVTLPIAYPTMSTNVADYTVAIEGSVNETFYVNGKTNTQFVINSSNAGSTAVVRWTVFR